LPKSSPRFARLGKAEMPRQLSRWLDELDETGPLGVVETRDRRDADRHFGAVAKDRRRRTRDRTLMISS